MNIFRRIVAAVTGPVKCTPQRPYGFHGRVVTGLGMMGDANLCLRCGCETYHNIVGESYETTTRAIWPEIDEARNLPHGLTTKTTKPDPAFDAWFNSPLSDGSLPSWVKPTANKE